MTGAAAGLSPARFDAGVVAGVNQPSRAGLELKDIAQSGSGRKRRIDGKET
jgi:hypothetical protein